MKDIEIIFPTSSILSSMSTYCNIIRGFLKASLFCLLNTIPIAVLLWMLCFSVFICGLLLQSPLISCVSEHVFNTPLHEKWKLFGYLLDCNYFILKLICGQSEVNMYNYLHPQLCGFDWEERIG